MMPIARFIARKGGANNRTIRKGITPVKTKRSIKINLSPSEPTSFIISINEHSNKLVQQRNSVIINTGK